MTEYTKTGEPIMIWSPSERNYKEGWNTYGTTIRDKDHERFLAAFGNINRAELIRNLILKAIDQKESEKNEQAKES